MKILVTGHKGFIGQNLTLDLVNEGHEVFTYEWGYPPPNVRGMDWVIHLGAISSTTETNVRKILDQNVVFTIQLIEECIEHSVNMQFASSASIYGDTLSFREDGPVRPLNHYARSKFLIEQYIKTRNAPITIQAFRYFNVCGPNEDHKGSQASPYTQFRNQAIQTGKIKVFEGSEHCRRDFIPVSEIILLHKQFFNVKESGVWNFGTGYAKSFLDVAQEIAEKYDATIETIPFPEHLKEHYQYYTCADLTKLKATLSK
jgi:ADP-L-glycero-D-manno-heptose 6-epimerase